MTAKNGQEERDGNDRVGTEADHRPHLYPGRRFRLDAAPGQPAPRAPRAGRYGRAPGEGARRDRHGLSRGRTRDGGPVMGNLQEDTRVEGRDGRYTAKLSPDWDFWTPNGGYLSAIALRAAA